MTLESKEKYRLIIKNIENIIKNDISSKTKLKNICDLLAKKIDYYDWVGIYHVNKNNQSNSLVLGPYHGSATEHINIPFGKGLCGQVAISKKTAIFQDVSSEQNYLSCNINVKSEIVVPIFKNYKFVGEIDIDSHSLAPFKKDDKILLEKIAKIISVVF